MSMLLDDRGRPERARWQKSPHSNPNGNCVEIASLEGGTRFAIRNSRDPDGPVLIYTPEEIDAFLRGVRDGDFDNFMSR
jgi:hypothetical protein